MTIYLAGPITGLSYEEVVSRIERLQKELKKQVMMSFIQ